MKSLIALLTVSVLVSCNIAVPKKSIPEFMPGTYTRAIHHEFAIGNDTLVITQLNGDNYSIIKKAGYVRIANGKLLNPEHTSERWAGIYDEKAQVLFEQKQGRVLSFDVDNKRLFLGGSEYKKTE
jgi:hypothetical protein